MAGAQQVMRALFVQRNWTTHMCSDLGESQDSVVVPAFSLL